MITLIEKLVREGESETFEVKSANADVEVLARTVCGMLNQRGGIVVWGVSEPGEVTGLRDPESSERELTRYLMERLNPRPLISVSIHTIKDKRVIAVEVPASVEKPYSLDRTIWVRVGSATLRADTDRAAAIVARSATQVTRWEREATPGFSLEDCDRTEIEETRKEIESAGNFGLEVPSKAAELLVRLYLSRNNRLTNAAMVLFASDPLIWAPNIEIRVVVFAGDEKEQLENEQSFHEPAVRALRKVITTIQQRTGFSGQFSAKEITRQQRPAYALFALREGLVNAIVHRDYERPGRGVLVEIYPDRLVISNPGELPQGWSGKDLERKHESHPANPDIARVFHLRGLMEQLGLGTQKVIAACEELHAKRPKWETARGMVTLTLYRAPEPSEALQLDNRQRMFLERFERGATFKVNDYVQFATVSDRTARRELSDLEKKGFVIREGAGPSTVYRLAKNPKRD